ncbi:MAG: hypothetical protein JST54_12095 [Deltaproteobacteria bacterium]|nr:hypothetical protein [Deltaproteobacteria bacterium]
MLLDADGTTYGIHGDKDFAELVRKRGWLSKPPETSALLRLIVAAMFDGRMLVLDAPTPQVISEEGMLKVVFTEVRDRSDTSSTALTIDIGPRGIATVDVRTNVGAIR